MFKVRGMRILACLLAVPLAFLSAACLADVAAWKLEPFVRGPSQHGLHGLAFDAGDNLYAGSVVGQTIYRVNVRNGKLTPLVGPPHGMADDIAFAPDGSMVWTAFLLGKVYSKKGDGPIRILAGDLPGINSLAFDPQGRLFAAQVFQGDALYEIDPAGEKPPRKIMEGMGGLNGFAFDRAGRLYGPLWFKRQVVRIDVDRASLEVLADGFRVPAAVVLDGEGNLYVVDSGSGQVILVDPQTGKKTVLSKLATALDNIAVNSKNQLFVSNMADNSIHQVDRLSGRSARVVQGRLAAPGGLMIADLGDDQVLYIADLFAFRAVNLRTRAVQDIARMQGDVLHYPTNVSIAGPTARTAVLASWFTGTVQRIERRTGRTTHVLTDFNAPMHALDLPDGKMLVAEYGSGQLVTARTRDGSRREVLADGLGGPVAMVRKGWAGVFVSEALTGRISYVPLDGGQRRTVAEGLRRPEGIALLPSGSLVVAEAGARRLIEIDPESGRVAPILGDLPLGLPVPEGQPPTFLVAGVAVSRDGDIYFSSDLEGALYRVSRR